MLRRHRHTGSGESTVYHGHPAVAFFTFCLNSWACGPLGLATIIYRTHDRLHSFRLSVGLILFIRLFTHQQQLQFVKRSLRWYMVAISWIRMRYELMCIGAGTREDSVPYFFRKKVMNYWYSWHFGAVLVLSVGEEVNIHRRTFFKYIHVYNVCSNSPVVPPTGLTFVRLCIHLFIYHWVLHCLEWK